MAKKKETVIKSVKVSGKKTDAAKTPVKKKAAVKKEAPKKITTKTSVKKKEAKTPALKKKAVVKKTASPKKATVKKNKPVTSKSVVKDANQLLVDAAVEGILEVKGRNISILDLRKIRNRVCDYYLICQADSNTQVKAIADSVEVLVKKQVGEKPYHSEGFQNSEWILVDYVTVVIHIFQSHIREFYNLEALWADAEIKEIAFD